MAEPTRLTAGWLVGAALALLLAGGCAAPAATPEPTATAVGLVTPEPGATATAVEAGAAPASVVGLPRLTPAPETRPPTRVSGNLPAASPVEFVRQLNGGANKFDRPSRVAVDGQGNLFVLDMNNFRVQKFDRDGVFQTMWGSRGSGAGEFMFQFSVGFGGGIAADARGFVYVSDAMQRVQKFDGAGALVKWWGGEGSRPGQFQRPTGLAIDGQGGVYVADGDNHRIQKFDADGQFLAQWGRQGEGNGEFQRPSGIAIDRQGVVYISDQLQRIQRFDADGRFLGRWGVRGNGPAEFTGGVNLAVDPAGVILATDSGNNRVQVFDREGNYLTQWGSFGDDIGQFATVGGIAVDGQGGIYVAEITQPRVQKFLPRTPWTTSAKGTPTPRPPTPSPTPSPTPTLPARPILTPTDR